MQMSGRVIILVVAVSVSCAPDPCADVACGANAVCSDGGCACDSGFIAKDGACTDDHTIDAQCCHCLATHSDGISDRCIPDEVQCVEALDNNASLSTSNACVHQQCPGDCFNLR